MENREMEVVPIAIIKTKIYKSLFWLCVVAGWNRFLIFDEGNTIDGKSVNGSGKDLNFTSHIYKKS